MTSWLGFWAFTTVAWVQSLVGNWDPALYGAGQREGGEDLRAKQTLGHLPNRKMGQRINRHFSKEDNRWLTNA